MAFRIHDSVVGGEIDNRRKGTIRGRIWLEGLIEPLTLELTGNAHPDLAGCLLTFQNPKARFRQPHLDTLSPLQRGAAGDMTASRKVRVVDLPEPEIDRAAQQEAVAPERVANTLYLEWFSESNGRVVIESADYQFTISAPEWQLTPEENEQRAREVERAMTEFIATLNSTIEQHQRGQKDPAAPWNEHDYERFLRESDARATKYYELLDKYSDSPEAEERIVEAMGWDCEMSEEEAEAECQRIDELNRACEEAMREPPAEPEPHREGIDWIRTKHGDLRHPLQHRCFESAMRFHREIEEYGLDDLEDKALDDFLFEFETTSVKLGGALGSIVRNVGPRDPAFTVACLKRALSHLHKAQAGLEALSRPDLLPDDFMPAAREELFAIREGILQLMEQLRSGA